MSRFWRSSASPSSTTLLRVEVGPRRLIALVLSAAAWGMVVDWNTIPILAPTGNSTLFQASTAAAFALLGALFGPWIGAAGGLIRDGMSFVVELLFHPATALEPHWAARKAADIFEDMILGLGPGLAVRFTREVLPLSLAAAVSAWVSLPFLVICNTLVAGDFTRIGHALTTRTGDWDQPVDPGLTVYALLAGCFTALMLARMGRKPWWAVAIPLPFGLAAMALIAMGAHT